MIMTIHVVVAASTLILFYILVILKMIIRLFFNTICVAMKVCNYFIDRHMIIYCTIGDNNFTTVILILHLK